jgi:hypothetical protein
MEVLQILVTSWPLAAVIVTAMVMLTVWQLHIDR